MKYFCNMKKSMNLNSQELVLAFYFLIFYCISLYFTVAVSYKYLYSMSYNFTFFAIYCIFTVFLLLIHCISTVNQLLFYEL
jgi:hypothetical protein